MRVLFLSRSNTGEPHAFVKEQADALIRQYKFEIDHLLISEGGFAGFFNAIIDLRKSLKRKPVEIVHVHYGLWTMVALINKWLFFKKMKVVVTYHGSDIFKNKERPVSLFGARFVSRNILVTERMIRYFSTGWQVIPCGIDIDIQTGYRIPQRIEKQWGDNDFVVLFSSSFDRPVKDPAFALKVIEELKKTCKKKVHFIELKGYNRRQLTSLMQAADALVMCSFSEGSPQVIKEAILNSLPIVSNNVGDVAAICKGADNTFIIEKSVAQFVMSLDQISNQGLRISNKSSLLKRFDNKVIADKIYIVYANVLNDSGVPFSAISLSSTFSPERTN